MENYMNIKEIFSGPDEERLIKIKKAFEERFKVGPTEEQINLLMRFEYREKSETPEEKK